MHYDVYDVFHIAQENHLFEFFSIGFRGVLLKRVVFQPTRNQFLYNLVMGDVDINGNLNCDSISNNGDTHKVLATIIRIVEMHLSEYPRRVIGFYGNTIQKTRLYRMLISNNLEYLLLNFMLYSLVNDKVILFKKNMPVDVFFITTKS